MSLFSHSGHDVGHLLDRWERLAEKLNWKCSTLGEENGYPVWIFESGESKSGEQVYVSAGVHGDECAPIWALLHWAESAASRIDSDFVLVPCFNPVGIVENTRANGHGVDLNRHFQSREIDVIRSWQDYLKGRRFDIALNLHEDYDARGIYLYEVARGNPKGEQILSACEELIPRETAETVDGSSFQNGLLSHDEDVSEVIENDLEGGWPEALYLYVHHAISSYTFETPSEFALDTRIAAHLRCLETLFP